MVSRSPEERMQFFNMLKDDEKDAAMAKIANKLPIDEGRQLVDKISDPALKKATEGRVWQVEKNQLQKEANATPGQLVDSIVAGQSKYADYWLEEAMGTWVAKDFDKAQEWYEKNWKSMPSDKSQYVAAAFANQALKQGDAATASQWAALIQDPKTKQRIQDGINKAGNNKK